MLCYLPIRRSLASVRKAAAAILAAKCPVIYSGTGVQWAEAWAELRELAELLGAPVTTSLGGKSSFPETHPLSLNSGGNALPGLSQAAFADRVLDEIKDRMDSFKESQVAEEA